MPPPKLTRLLLPNAEFAPKFSHEPQNALVQPNKPHTIECPVESNPEAEVRWFKDRRVLASEPSHLEITGNELMFFQINQRDSGQYHCEASNYLGSIRSQPFRLSVETTTSKYNLKSQFQMQHPTGSAHLRASEPLWLARNSCSLNGSIHETCSFRLLWSTVVVVVVERLDQIQSAAAIAIDRWPQFVA